MVLAAGLVTGPSGPAGAAPAMVPETSCGQSQVDAATAARSAEVCGRSVEILAERTEYSQTFANPDGTQTFEENLEPVRVRKGSSWVPVDTSLKKTAHGVQPRATVLPMTFSAGGTGPLATLTDQGRELSMSWPGPLPEPTLRGDTALYRDVLPGVDLKVTAEALGFSEVLVVRTRQAARDPRLSVVTFDLSTKGVTVAPADGGGLAARTGDGETIFTAPAPLMWDSSATTDTLGVAQPDPAEKAAPDGPENAVGGKPAPSTAADGGDATLEDGRQDGGDTGQTIVPVELADGKLTLTPDRGALAGPGIQLPVYIDPSWSGYVSDNAWTSVWSKHKSSSFWKNASALQNGSTIGSAGAGRTEDCSGCADHIIRSMFRMDTNKVRGKDIRAAKFRVEQGWSWTCSPKSNAKVWMTGAISSSTTWNNQPTWYGGYTAQTLGNHKYGSAHGCLGTGPIEFDVKSLVAKSAKEGWTNLTLGLRAVDESTKNQWKRFNHKSAKLAITYNTSPNAPSDRQADNKGCAVGAKRPYVLRTDPVLAAQQTDPDSTDDRPLTTTFRWWPLGGSSSSAQSLSFTGGNPAPASRQIPAGKLADGGTYVWQARTSDGWAESSWSGTCEFTVDATSPPAPTAITSADYPSTGDPGGGVGVQGEFRIAPPAERPFEVVAYAWTLDSQTQPSAAPTVPASSTDHSGTLLYRPIRDGIHTLRIWSKDHAGRFSGAAATYTFTVPVGAGPAAYWRFDEESGAALDIAEHGNTLTPSSGASRTAGRSASGQALTLNGTASAATAGPVTAPAAGSGIPAQVRTDAEFTVTAWVRLASTTGSTGFYTAVAADSVRRSPFMLGYNAPTGQWRFTLTGADTDSSGLYHTSSTSTATLGKWTHLAGVYDTSTATPQIRLYVNGTLQSTTAVPSTFHYSGGLTVGRRMWSGAADSYLVGAVDEVRIYSFAESASKIAELAVPLAPGMTFPNGSTATAGGGLDAVFDARGDVNVTRFRYSVATMGIDQEVAAGAAGGTASVTLPAGSVVGEHTLRVVAVDERGRVSAPSEQTFTVTPSASLAGIVMDSVEYLPVAGATLRLEPAGLQAVAGADGGFTFSGFSPGTYTLSGSYGGRCGLTGSVQVEVSGPGAWQDLYLSRNTDGLGYTCTAQAAAFTTADGVLGLTGDDAVATVGLPFAFPFYGASYRSAWVDTNGIVSFTDPGGSHPYDGAGLPSTTVPQATVAGFWDDLVVDAAASVRTAATGSGDTARFTVEWRNVARKADPAQRLSFEVILVADGTVTINYTGLDNDAERGSQAAVGIQAPAAADGFAYSAGAPALATERAISFDHPEAGRPVEVHDLSGTLTDSAGGPVAGATVALDPSGLTAVTGAGGAWHFDDLVADSYTVSSTSAGRCPMVATAQVELTADTVQPLRLGPDYGGMGYACTTGTTGYVAATTVLPLTGDDAATATGLPFAFTFHGRSYTTALVHTNGLVNFGDVSGEPDAWANPSMPTAAAPNSVVAPFWEDLVVDSSASVRTLAQGATPNRSFIIEWRNVLLQGLSDRLTFEAVLHEDGRIAFHYQAMSTPPQQGAGATIGLENASGTVAALYSFQEAALEANTSITYTPAAVGTIGGTLTTAVTAEPVSGAVVTLNPGGRTATTGTDGAYQFMNVAVGEYTVAASTGGASCAGQYARQVVNHPGGASDVDLSVMTDGDEGGYTCSTGAQSFIPGDTVEDWSGDETVWQKNPPFPVKLYGSAYTSAWISANGLVSFKDPAYFGWIGSQPSPIPSPAAEGVPNAAVYVHWDDWVVDSAARIATKTSGVAPNRQWVVEWRNVRHYDDPDARATFEAIFEEAGGISLAYADIDTTSLLERGAGATVGIENASGAIGFQYLYQESLLATGQGVRFAPGTPGTGSIAGTVTCVGVPVSGAKVAVGGQSTTSASDGGYRVEAVPAGTYAVVTTLTGGSCPGSRVSQVVVGKNSSNTVDVPAEVTPSGGGYTLVEEQVPYTPVTGSVLGLTGDDAYTGLALPFPVTLYGKVYETGWVDTNGLIAFVDPGEPSPDAWPIPSLESPEEPNAAVYPFWHDWVVDAAASVRTETTGTAPNRQFLVEWRNVYSYEDPATRVTFEVILTEGGGITFAYTDVDGTFLELGGGATIGIENEDGTAAVQYTYRQPVLRPGLGLRLAPPSS